MASLTLWAVALGMLVLGNYVGFGEPLAQEADLTLGLASAAFGLIAVVIALPDAAARIALGMALTVQTLSITAAGFFPRFRFVWEGGDTQMTVFLAVVAVVALWMLSILVGSGQSQYARSSNSSWSTETRIRVRRTQFSRELWIVLWAVLAVGGALLGHDLGTLWGNAPVGLVIGVGSVALAHQGVWWARHRHERR